MNEIQLYAVIMFIAGVILSHAVFYFDRKSKQKKFYIIMSATILQVLDSIHSVHLASIEFAKQELKTIEETSREEYLEVEEQKVQVFMELYTLLFIRAVPEQGRKYIKYRSWDEASSLIIKARGLINDRKAQG
tara:strand:+ start:1920 stop:2318 length:399 start_codon:yes stop_codon:yes gene_type:complete